MTSKLKPLSSLTTDDVVIVMEMLGIKSCEEMIRVNMIDGSALAVIESHSEFSYLGLLLPENLAIDFYNTVQAYKRTGVLIDRTIRRNLPTTNKSTVYDDHQPEVFTANKNHLNPEPINSVLIPISENIVHRDLPQRSQSPSLPFPSPNPATATKIELNAALSSDSPKSVSTTQYSLVSSASGVQSSTNQILPMESYIPNPMVGDPIVRSNTSYTYDTTNVYNPRSGAVDIDAVLNRKKPDHHSKSEAAVEVFDQQKSPTDANYRGSDIKVPISLGNGLAKLKKSVNFAPSDNETFGVSTALDSLSISDTGSRTDSLMSSLKKEHFLTKSNGFTPANSNDRTLAQWSKVERNDAYSVQWEVEGTALPPTPQPPLPIPPTVSKKMTYAGESSINNHNHNHQSNSMLGGYQSNHVDDSIDIKQSYFSNYGREVGSHINTVNAIVSIGEVVTALREAVAEIEDSRLAVRAFDFVHLAVGDDPGRQLELGRVVGVESSIVKLLKSNIDNPNICEYGCRAVCALAFDNYEICEKLGQAGLCQVIGAILHEHLSVAPVAEAACLAVKELAAFTESDNATQLGSKALAESLLHTLKAHMNDPNVSKAVCSAVRALAYNTENRLNLLSENICDYLILVLTTHIQIGSVAEVVALAIFNICLSPEGRSTAGEIGGCEVVVKALRHHISVPDVAGAGCRALCMLAQDNPVNKKKLNDLGVCDLVTVCLRNHARSPQVAEAACFTVKNLCEKADVDSLAKFGGAGMCSLVAHVLVNHTQHGSVIKSALFACANLAFHVDNINQLGDAGVCEAVVRAVALYASNPRIAEAGCQAIYQLSFSDANRSDLGEANGCEVVCNITKLHMLVPDTVIAACKAICILAFKHANHKDLLSALGACEHLVSIMKIHKAVPVVSEWACQAAANLCVHNTSNQTQLGDYGMCSVMVDLLLEHKRVPTAVEAALRAITILAEDNDMNLSELYGEGVCEALLEALKSHLGSKGVVEWGSRSIITLAGRNVVCKTTFGNLGACKILVNAVKEHIQDSIICTWGWKAIHCLTENDYSNSTKFSVTKAHEYVVASLTTHESDPNASAWACKVVSILASYSLGNSVKLAATGACAAVVRVLWNHVEDAVVAEAGCRALAALADDDVENATVLCENSACEAVMHAITLHGTQVNVAEIGCKGIANLVRDNKESQTKLGDTGACDTLVALLLFHQKEAIVVAQALQVLYILANHDENKVKIINGGVCKIITMALKTHLKSIDVAVEACRAVTVFAKSDVARGLFKSLNTSRLVMDAMITQGADAGAVVDACRALCTLGDSGRGKALPVEPVITAMNTHVSHADVATHACKLLHSLLLATSVAGEGKPPAVDSSAACSALTVALVAHCKDARAAYQICRAICTLAAIDNDAGVVEGRFANQSSCTLLVKTIQYNIQDAGVAEAACGALNNICVNDLTRAILGEVGACEAIISVLEAHRPVSTVICVGCTTLYNLSGIGANRARLNDAKIKKLLEDISEDSNLSVNAQEKAKSILSRYKTSFLFW